LIYEKDGGNSKSAFGEEAIEPREFGEAWHESAVCGINLVLRKRGVAQAAIIGRMPEVMMGVFRRFADLTAERCNRIAVDSDGGLSAVARAMFPELKEDELVLFVIDDSPFFNRQNMVVFTNKNIYWNLQSVSLSIAAGNTKSVTSGPSRIELGQLSSASIFTREDARSTTVYAVSKTVQMEIRLRHKIHGDIIRLYFSEKLLNYSGGYNPDRKTNTVLFKEFVAERKKHGGRKRTPRDVMAALLGGAHVIVHGLLLALSLWGLHFTELEIPMPPLFSLALLFCLLNAFFGRKNSAALSFLLISVVCGVFLAGIFTEIPIDTNRLFLTYSIAALILNTVDFDRIFKQITGFFAICAVIFMLLHFLM
jgi:hypothetical protein